MNEFDQIRSHILTNNSIILGFIDQLQQLASASGHENGTDHSRAPGPPEEDPAGQYMTLQLELDARAKTLEKRIHGLKQTKEALLSNHLPSGTRQQHVVQLTGELESAYEEISTQNTALKKAYAHMLEKNRAMELQKNALQEQTYYLHRANESLTGVYNQLKNQREDILKKNEELLRLNNAKNNFIEVVAHDLKSPLDHIKGFVSLIKSGKARLDEKTYQFIRMIEHCAVSLSDMVTNILDTEIIESRKLDLILERADLSEILETLSDRFKVEAEQKAITIHTRIRKEMYALVDRTYVNRVFQNLISNAIKFSPRNRNVFVHLDNGGARIICKIKDEGPGISAEDRKKLFDKYQRLSARPTGGESSTGLGLSIVKKFVETMNGEIWCESNKTRGACFVVAFDKAGGSL